MGAGCNRTNPTDFTHQALTTGAAAGEVAITGPAKGRGAIVNPPNRFETLKLEVLPTDPPADVLETVEQLAPGGGALKTTVYRDQTRTILNPVDSPDINFSWSINPYRGCEHGCIYCYARPGHEYLGLSCGTDFESKIFAKPEAAALLRAELMKPGWQGEWIAISGVTDPYQPVEAKMRITRSVLEVCAEFRQPVSLVTKNKLVTRDLDVLARLNEHRAVGVAVSLTTLDSKLAAIMEPRASTPRDRLAAIRALSSAGIPVTVMTAPIIPAINDHELPGLLEAAAEAGASGAGYVLLRLPHQIKTLFLSWVQAHFPDRAAKVESLIRQTRDGELYQTAWRERQRGAGPVAEQISQTFTLFRKRHGLNESRAHDRPAASPFRRPEPVAEGGGQMRLFGGAA